MMHHEIYSPTRQAWAFGEAEIRLNDGIQNHISPVADSSLQANNRVVAWHGTMPGFAVCNCLEGICPQTSQAGIVGSGPIGFLTGIYPHSFFLPQDRIFGLKSPAEVTLASQLPALSLLNRRRIACQLSIGMLRLHNTGWLRGQWGKNEVVVFTDANRPLLWSLSIIVNITDSTILAPGAVSSARCRSIRNDTIFALGVMLIELALKKPFEEMWTPEDQHAGTHAEYNAASRLVDKVQEEAGFRYADVVRRCIRCEFDLREDNLEKPELQRRVFCGVVKELLRQVQDLDPEEEEMA